MGFNIAVINQEKTMTRDSRGYGIAGACVLLCDGPEKDVGPCY